MGSVMIGHERLSTVSSAAGPRRRRHLFRATLRLALITATVGALMVTAAASPAAATTTTPAQIVIPNSYLYQVACASATTCYAVGGALSGPVEIIPITNGIAGTPQALPQGYALPTVVCYDATTCVAYGGYTAPGSPRGTPPQPIQVVITNGVIGAPQPVPYIYSNVACFTAAYCVGVTVVPANGVPHLATVVITNGVAGTAQVVPANVQSISDVACASATACYVVGQTPPDPNYPDPFFGDPQPIGVILPIVNGAVGTPRVDPDVSAFYGVGCASATTCYAVGSPLDIFAFAPLLVPIVNGVPGKAQPLPGGTSIGGIACSSPAICEAVGYDNSGNGGVVVPVINGLPGPAHVVAGASGLQDVACSAPNCVAIGSFNPPNAASVGVVTLITEPELMCNGQIGTVVGTAGPDKLFGTSGPDVMVGLGGNDSIYGYGGDDTICAGDGNDVVYGGAGNDLVDGGAGNDTIVGDAGNDDLQGGDGSDRLFAGAGNDQLNGGPATDYCYKGTGTVTFIDCDVFPAGM
ncbi:MAG: hypothetical protein LC749_01405 [Actinobacteria bacterium]|nr:hypothetical protein [Actinomycetota bacterium]